MTNRMPGITRTKFSPAPAHVGSSGGTTRCCARPPGDVIGTASIGEDITESSQARRRLEESEAKYRELIAQAADGIFVSDDEDHYLLVNPRGCELLGYTESELLSMTGKDTCLEDDKQMHAERIELVRSGRELRFERLVRRKDGTAFPAQVSKKMLENGTLQVVFHDITERHNQEQKISRLSRVQAVLSGINSAIVRIRDRNELFSEACRIAVEQGQFRMAWIGLVDKTTMRVEPVASAGYGTDILDTVRLAIGESAGEGMAVMAASVANKAPIVVNDIETHAGILYRTALLERGCRSLVVLPL